MAGTSPPPSSSFLSSLKREYGTTNLYTALGLSKDAKESEIKRAYYKLSLKVHPDRVEKEEVEQATVKFQLLSKINAILSDSEKRKFYNETGVILGEEDESDGGMDVVNWTEAWKLMFKSVTIEDIRQFEVKYKGSVEEEEELQSAYLDYEGDMDKILETVMCAELEDEPRYRRLINKWINEGAVPSFPSFTEDNEDKRKKRKRKRDNEAREAEKMKKELGLGDESDSLKMLIKARQKDREKAANSFFDSLEEKYGGKNKKKKTTVSNGKGKKGKKK